MRNLLLLTCVLGIVCCASTAQTNQPALAKLGALKPGEKIQIVETNSKKHTGAFESVSESAIAIRETAGEGSVPLQDVRSVKLITKRRLRNTLIGLGVGGGAGAAIGAGIGPSNGFIIGKGYSALFVGALGAIGGTVVGVLLPTHETVYTATPH
jgi:hypothetical protein